MSSSAVGIMERLKRAWFGKISSAEPIGRPDLAYSAISGWEEECRLLAAFDEMTIGAALIGSDGKFLQVNRALCGMFECSPDELVNNEFEVITHPAETNDWSQIQHALSKSSDSLQIERLYRTKTGHTIWANVTVTPIRNNQERTTSFLSRFYDITQYKQPQKLLQQDHLFLRGILEGIPDAVFVKDKQGRYLTINSIGAKLLGRPMEEVVGKSDIELFPFEEIQQAIEIDREVIESGISKSYELTLTIEGLTRVILSSKTPLLNSLGEVTGVVVVARDVTDNQRASESLENSRAELRALSARLQSVREEERMRIAREIHDELGQVLTGLKIDLVSLTKKISGSVDAANWEMLKGRTQGITDLINNAIQTVRKISTELRPGLLDAVGLTAAIEWHAKEFETRTGIKCKLKFSHQNITLDQHRSIAVFRIFQEVLTNVARHAQATEVEVIIEVKSSELLLEARDNGRGIRASEFSNPKSLGLLGMRERALLLGGEVQLRGVPGKGTTVNVRIPLDR